MDYKQIGVTFLTVVVAIAAYDLLAKPMINKAKVAAPSDK